MKPMSVLVLTMCSLMCPPGAEALEIYAGEIVGISARTAKPAGQAPGSISIVLRKEIEAKTVQAADQALNALPGVFNRRGKGLMDSSAAITLRGVPDQKRTLILFDGVPVNSAYDGSVSYGGLQPEDIERVELARGPFSGLYGGNAMGGVVNFVQRRPAKREVALKAGCGSKLGPTPAMQNMTKGYISYGDKVGARFSFMGSYGYKRTAGYPTDFNVQSAAPAAGLTGWSPTTTSAGAARYLVGNKGDNGWQENSFSLRAWYDISDDDRLNVSVSRLTHAYFYQDPETYLRDAAGAEVWTYGTVRENTFLSGDGGREQNNLSVVYDKKLGETAIRASIGIIDTPESWYITPSTFTATTRAGGPGKISDTLASSYVSEVQATVPELLPRNSFTGGVSYRFSKAMLRENDLSNWKDEDSGGELVYKAQGKNADVGVYLQDEIRLHEKLTAYLAARLDWWRTYDGGADQTGTAGYPKSYGSRTDSAFSPKASLVYVPLKKTRLLASAGRSFRSPNVYELYRTWRSGSTTYTANPALKPETVTSWDAGVEHWLWQGMKVGAVYFENSMEDLIYRSGTGTRENQNAGKAFGNGWELEAEQVFEKGDRVFANLTVNDARIVRNPASPASVGKKLTDLPRRMYSFGGDYRAGRFSLGALGRYVSKRYTTDANTDTVEGVLYSRDPYFTAEAKVAYAAFEGLSISLAVQNVFDEKYYDSYRAPGRSWFAELAWRL